MAVAYSDPVLLVEDTQSLSMIYQKVMAAAGYYVDCAFTMAEAMRAYGDTGHRIILLDLTLPDGDGLDLLRKAREIDPGVKVVVITANASINRAVEAMRDGAFDFLVKPFDDRRLLTAVDNAIASLALEATEIRSDPQDPEGFFEGFVGSSQAMQSIYRMVSNIGRSNATVFITGESGTGKEVCAEAIHNISTRRQRPFVPLNCSAIPNDLLESEVFGHLKGSFTGAIGDKVGAAAAADGGTLFLDEICDMDLGLQTKLLRFLQTSTVQPVGAVKPQKVDVRIICATNRDPAEEVRAGRFREDLYYRLHVVPIVLPPLRDRGEDVIEIAERLLNQFVSEENKTFTEIAPEAQSLLRRYHWPGNVRELQNVLRNAVVLNDGSAVTVEMLRANLHGWNDPGLADAVPQMPGPSASAPEPGEPHLDMALQTLVGTPLAALERQFIQATIDACDGSIPRAARLLEVSPSTLYRKRESWAGGD